jgi:putative transposase
MPLGLKRYQRRPYLHSQASKDAFLDSLERTRKKYRFELLGYVVMPEHVHILMNEPPDAPSPKPSNL